MDTGVSDNPGQAGSAFRRTRRPPRRRRAVSGRRASVAPTADGSTVCGALTERAVAPAATSA
jgi:hypothetical protein